MSAVLSHPVNVEEKLFQNRYKVDHGRPHIQIKNADISGSGNVAFGLNVFGNALLKSGTIALPPGF